MWWMLRGSCYAVPTNGAERGFAEWLKEDGKHGIAQIASQQHVNTFITRFTLIGVGGSEVHELVWGLLLCRVYRMAKARLGVHDLDSGDVDGESGT